MDFEEVYRQYSGAVFAYAFSLCGNHAVAEDITSDTFLKAIRHSGDFRGECPLKSWLCQIAKNTYRDFLRRRSKLAEMPEDMSDCTDFERDVLRRDAALSLHRRLHTLSEPYKEVFSLRIFSELSFAEIGEIFARSEVWARVTFHRAKLKIKEGEGNV
ncbi:MAG: sigma-70 family RNA polymerase sigma factor [Oscillospiraceae bacterium]|nr:sigma-70 family RNA polymerase sigma factor [Oscillospiraceae bacterium]